MTRRASAFRRLALWFRRRNAASQPDGSGRAGEPSRNGGISPAALVAGDSRRDRADIAIDDREKPSGLPEAIERVAGFAPSVERLEVGDALVGGTYLVERKTWADLAASIADGRWFAQLAEMKRQPFRPIVVIEGDWKSLGELGVSAEALRGALLAATLDRGIPLLPSSSVEGTAKWLAALLARCERDAARPNFRAISPDGRRVAAGETEAPVATPKRPQARRPDAETRLREGAVAALAAVEGVGEARAKALLERFGTVARVASASEAELCAAPGVGKELARRIRAMLGGSGDEAPAKGSAERRPPNPFQREGPEVAASNGDGASRSTREPGRD